MNRRAAAAGSAAFFLLAPFTVVGVVPALVTGWTVDRPWPLLLRAPGIVLVVPAFLTLVHAFRRFVVEGLGTPAPIAPTERLVVGGAYRHVRNPMYLSVLAGIAGQGLWFGSPSVLAYGGVVLLAVSTFVRVYEEPTLRERYGEAYERYCAAVPRWWPRLRPWSG